MLAGRKIFTIPTTGSSPITTGTYGVRQNLPDDLKDQFKAYLDAGVAEVDPAKRSAIYEDFNQLYYDANPGLPTVLGTSHGFEQKWVEGVFLTRSSPVAIITPFPRPTMPTIRPHMFRPPLVMLIHSILPCI